MKTSLKLIAAAFCCALLPVSAGPHIDAANWAADWSSPQVFPIGGWLQSRLAQTLTVEIGGTAAGVWLPIYCVDGILRVEIQDVIADEPGGKVLARGEIDAKKVFPAPWTFIALRGRPIFSVGDPLAIVMSNDTGECELIPSPLGVDYLGGKGSFETIYQHNFLSDFPGLVADDFPFALVLN